MKSSVKTSVLVITKNRPMQLRQCLQSIIEQTQKPDEIIVVDSSDKPQKKITQQFKQKIKIVYLHEPYFSIPQARNECIKLASYNNLLFLDDDCVAEKDWINKMSELSLKNPKAVLISSILEHIPKNSVYALIISQLRKQRTFIADKNQFIYFNIENCLIKKNFLIKHNIFFDTSMYHEEFADLALQIQKNAGTIVFSDQTKVFHSERNNLFSFLKQRFKNSGNIPRLKQKYPHQKFHFYASRRTKFIAPFLDILKVLFKRKKFLQLFQAPVIVVLSIVIYELGHLYHQLKYNKKINAWYLQKKPIIDFFLALFLFIIFIPIMILIAIIIILDSPGPIIFSQTRLGKNLKKFRFYKFRTMWVDAKNKYPDLYRYKYTNDKIKTFRFKTLDDPRLTRFGKYLRKTSLDELPNLINVLKGDMHLIGPRPEIPEMLLYYSKEEKAKFSIKPGVTGFAQIKGRGLLTFRQTLSYDLQYIHEQGLITDLEIIIKTIYIVLLGIGAF